MRVLASSIGLFKVEVITGKFYGCGEMSLISGL